MRFKQVGQCFVAEVTGVDLGKISKSQFQALYEAWLEFGVLKIRDQSMSDGELQRFSNRFGPLEEIPYGKISEKEKQKGAQFGSFSLSQDVRLMLSEKSRLQAFV